MNYVELFSVGLGIPALFLIFVLVFAGPQWLKGIASRSWPQTDGRVLHSEVASTKFGRRRFVAPNVRYEYHVEGQRHEGSTVRFNFSWTDASAGAAVAAYPVGQEIKVSYKQTKPEKSVLQTGIDVADVRRAMLIPAFVAGIFIAAIIFVMLRHANVNPAG
jgi:hypothetical protein